MTRSGGFGSGLSAILDVLHSANAMRGELPQPPPEWDIRTVGFRRRVSTGVGRTVPTEPVEAVRESELLIVPAVTERRPASLVSYVSGNGARAARGLLAEVRSAGTPIASACTFLLAESGVFDGQRATTSWWLSPVFRARYPAVDLDETTMVTVSGGITTAGAAFSHLDLALSIVRTASPALADLVSRYLVLDDRPSQAAYTIPAARAQSDPTVAAFERWAREHLHEPLVVSEAARALGISERTLQRAVSRTLGTTPVRFVQDLRVEQATHLLRTTSLPLPVIARRVGHENPGTLRLLLRTRAGTTATHLRGRA
ncbi:helix-turn-helix domain-containing protein [Streptomyces sp. NPDC019396]|uniref:GlxA family transcriptional regulator n=1 Tax=Streptomyces sp. NPDC019396 TaxID=3154687 RepID=UPI0033C2359C